MEGIKNLLSPRSVAIIGASRNSEKIGYTILKNVIDFGFKGKIFPINQSGEEILGLKTFKNLNQVKSAIDLAVIVIPAEFVEKALKDCGKKRIKSVVIISAGFREIGEKGEKVEEKIKQIAQKNKITILGPNCLGFINVENKLNITFARNNALKGKISVFSQSGAICSAILDWAQKENVGFSKFLSLGNKVNLSENEVLRYLENDNKTSVIAGYLEGIERGREFVEIASRVSRKKPMILIKAGTSQKAQTAIMSHTGAIAGENQVINAAFNKAGVIRVSGIQELFNCTEIFEKTKLPNGGKLAVITNAGGLGVLATDQIEVAKNLEITKLSKTTITKLSKVLPVNASKANPIDLVGDANAERYKNALKIVGLDNEVSAILVLLTAQTTTEVEKTAEVVVDAAKISKKPIVACFVGGENVAKGIEILRENNIPTFEFPEQAIFSLDKLVEYANFRRKKHTTTQSKKIIKKKVPNEIYQAKLFEIVKSYGINLLNPVVFDPKNEGKAVIEARKIGYPVVLKVDSPSYFHKTDVGGVILNIRDENELKSSLIKMEKVVKKNDFKNVCLYKMVKKGAGVIIGAKRDDNFGIVVMFGLGGTLVEIYKDTVLELAPLSKNSALEMINGIKAKELLNGFRGSKRLDKDFIVETMLKISKIIEENVNIKEIEINPLFVYKKGGEIVDARIVLK